MTNQVFFFFFWQQMWILCVGIWIVFRDVMWNMISRSLHSGKIYLKAIYFSTKQTKVFKHFSGRYVTNKARGIIITEYAININRIILFLFKTVAIFYVVCFNTVLINCLGDLLNLDELFFYIMFQLSLWHVPCGGCD